MALEFKQFNFENIKELDGGLVPRAFDHLMSKIMADLNNRPTVKTARKLDMSWSFKPVVDEAGNLDGANIACTFSTKAPAQTTKTFSTTVRRKRGEVIAAFPVEMAGEDAPVDAEE